MRIIGGSLAGRRLEAPAGPAVRPTLDRVRQALFNSLGTRVEGARVLDLFSGTGALGFECLSRGAGAILSVESDPGHARLVRRNAALLQVPPAQHAVCVADVFALLPRLHQEGQRFDLIIADPPFGEKNVGRRSTSFAQRLLDDASLPLLLRPGGVFVLGHARRDTLSIPAGWEEDRVLAHGDSVMRLLASAVTRTESA
jgi:16S rRNA (guanine966-N2)-methyltransferase